MYASCFVFGFGIMSIFIMVFLLGWWTIEKLQKVYIKWRNPWRELEEYLKR